MLLQFFERAIDIGGAHHGQILERTGGGLGDHVGKPHCAPFRNDDAARARGMRRAHDRAQIVRIFHAVEHHQQLRGGRDVVELRIALRPRPWRPRPDAPACRPGGRARRAPRSAPDTDARRARSMISCRRGPPAPLAIRMRSSGRPALRLSSTGLMPLRMATYRPQAG